MHSHHNFYLSELSSGSGGLGNIGGGDDVLKEYINY